MKSHATLPIAGAITAHSGPQIVLLTRQVTGADRWLAAQLRKRAAEVRLVCHDQIESKLQDAELLVVLTARPGEWPDVERERLMQLSPGAELVIAAGSWCEGELRTGQPWPDVQRVYWYNFPAWIDGWLAKRDGATHLSADDFPLIAVAAENRESFAAIAEAIEPHQFRAVWFPHSGPRPFVTGISGAVWSGPQLDGQRAAGLAAFCSEMRTLRAPVIAMLDFPRIDEMQLAQQVGAAGVIGKPWLVESLVGSLREAITPVEKAHVKSNLKLAA